MCGFVPAGGIINDKIVAKQYNKAIVNVIAKGCYDLNDEEVKEVEAMVKPRENNVASIAEIAVTYAKEMGKEIQGVGVVVNAISNTVSGKQTTEDTIKACKEVAKRHGK